MQLEHQQVAAFQESVWGAYRAYGRPDLPWRLPSADGSFDPYHIMVSELMLQQTQVARVVPKYTMFLRQFPTVQALAAASLGDVLRAWQGLGYNRRAKYLWQAAQKVAEGRRFPATLQELVRLPGIGPNTAGAVLAYAYDQPVVFVETNIRTVYIHHFFADRTDVSDKEIAQLVAQTLPAKQGKEQPETSASPKPGAMRKTIGLSHRDFYWALMDYGTHLKTTIGNLNKASKHYAKQSKFHGSRRQLRGQVIRLLGERPLPLADLSAAVPDERLQSVLDDLVREGLVRQNQTVYGLE